MREYFSIVPLNSSVSYSCFFAAFDITRRIALRVKALLGGGGIPKDWGSFVVLNYEDTDSIPTIARVAQASTLVAGGIGASFLAEISRRPFQAFQKILEKEDSFHRHPILQTYHTQGLRPFLYPKTSSTIPQQSSTGQLPKALSRLGWRLAAVGPWGIGFLVWAYVGGEV